MAQEGKTVYLGSKNELLEFCLEAVGQRLDSKKTCHMHFRIFGNMGNTH